MDTLVMTNIAAAPLPHEEFLRRLKALVQLRDVTRKAVHAASLALLKFATEYAMLYQEVSGSAERVGRLNKALHLHDFAATRLRTIAGQSHQLLKLRDSFQDSLPAALEPLYEVSRALKHDEKAGTTHVRQALTDRRITADSTLRDIRSVLRVPVVRVERQKHKSQHMTPARFLQALKRIMPSQSMVLVDMDVNDQADGGTITGRFLVTHVKPDGDGRLPPNVPDYITAAVNQFNK